MSKKFTTQEFIDRCLRINGDNYDYSYVNYINNSTKIKILCKKHNVEFEQLPSSHLRGHGCPKCGLEKSSLTQAKSLKDFIFQANEVHKNKYNYSNVFYKNTHFKIKILCLFHNIFFEQSPKEHLNGNGCPLCAKLNSKLKQTKTFSSFIEDAINTHGNYYNYDKVEYINALTKIIIICPKHGDFLQKPNSHLTGHGCPKCGLEHRINFFKLKQFSSFVAEANLIHHYKYIYFDDFYVNTQNKIKINCPIHGIFFQSPNSHLNGHGCPKCGKIISKIENFWLDSLNIINDKDHRQVSIKLNGVKYIVDGFDPITNTIYEFYGDKWHGNPKIYIDQDIVDDVMKITYREAYIKTINRENILKKSGYNIVSIWESDWKMKEVKNE